MDTIVITVKAINRYRRQHQLWEARIGDDLLCTDREPFLAAARVLQARGTPGATALVMRHAGSDTICLTSTVAKAAALIVKERDRGGRPRFEKYEPHPSSKTAAL